MLVQGGPGAGDAQGGEGSPLDIGVLCQIAGDSKFTEISNLQNQIEMAHSPNYVKFHRSLSSSSS